MNPAPVLSEKTRRTLTYLGAGVLVASVTLYLVLPVVALFFRTTPDLFLSSLAEPEVISALVETLGFRHIGVHNMLSPKTA